jgi:Na+-translocating ferredoxin:NAD+ oxidoreductase RNF subunit RnfB
MESKKIDRIIKLLPGRNCGACGFGSCRGLARAVSDNPEAVYNCVTLGPEEKDSILNLK